MKDTFETLTIHQLKKIKGALLNFLNEPTLTNLENLNQDAREYIDKWIQTNDSQKDITINEIKKLFNTRVPKPIDKIKKEVKTFQKVDRFNEAYQRSINIRNKKRVYKKNEWTDIEKFNYLINHFSKTHFRDHEEYTERQGLTQEKISLTSRRLNLEPEFFDKLGMQTVGRKIHKGGIHKTTHYFNYYLRREVPLNKSIDSDDRLISKFQNQRWATVDSSPSEKGNSNLRGRYFPTYKMLELFNRLLNKEKETEIGPSIENKGFDDKNISLINGFVIDQEIDKELDRADWGEVLLNNEIKLINEMDGFRALILESTGQRGSRQYLSNNSYEWRDVLIYNSQLMTLRSFTKDPYFVPKVKEDFFEGWYMSNNMPEIPNQCMREFIYYLKLQEIKDKKITLQRIAEEWGTTRERARQILKNTILLKRKGDLSE